MKYNNLQSYQHRPRLGNICIYCGKSCRSHPTKQKYWEIYWMLPDGHLSTAKAYMHKSCDDEQQPPSDDLGDGAIF